MLAIGVVVSVALTIVYAALWLHIDDVHIGRSDYTATYVGATLWRTDTANMYDEETQHRLHDAVISPDQEGNLPFVNAPLAAVVSAPLSLLPLHAAYWTFGVLQLAMLVGGVVCAAFAASWPSAVTGRHRSIIAVICLALPSTFLVPFMGQWDGLNALGLGLGFLLVCRGRVRLGVACILCSAFIAKPHLAVGLLAFMLAWRQRGVIAAVLATCAGAAFLSLAAIGPRASGGFLLQLIHSENRWHLRDMIGFTGISGAWLGDGTAGQVVGIGLACGGVFGCVMLGRRVRQGHSALEPALAAAVVLSLLIAPHAYEQDLAPISVAAVWVAASLARMGDGRPAMSSALRMGTAAWLGCVLLTVAAMGNLTLDVLVPYALVGLAWALARASTIPSLRSATGFPYPSAAVL